MLCYVMYVYIHMYILQQFASVLMLRWCWLSLQSLGASDLQPNLQSSKFHQPCPAAWHGACDDHSFFQRFVVNNHRRVVAVAITCFYQNPLFMI